MRISDWSSDVCSSDLQRSGRVLVQPVNQLGPSLSVEDQCVQQAVQVLSRLCPPLRGKPRRLVDDDRLWILVDDHVLRKSDFVFAEVNGAHPLHRRCSLYFGGHANDLPFGAPVARRSARAIDAELHRPCPPPNEVRSEGHTSELQSLMRISYAVFCLKKKTTTL